MSRKTIENCSLIKVYGKPMQYDGKCEGFDTSKNDDEPCRTCKGCKLNVYYED